MGIAIDWNVSIGTVVEIAGIVGGGAYALIIMKSTVDNLKTTIADVQLEIKEISRAMLQLAVQDNRIKNLEEDIREMRHLRGFIVDSSTPK